MLFVHQYQDLISIFNQCFAKEYNTQLIKGEDEPIYLPAHENTPFHALYFAHGFYSSALHECAHWLIAGEKRRQLVDFGYWYTPDGRTEEQQAIFQTVEVKPQAMEWILSKACQHRFRLSIDNLNGESFDTDRFANDVFNQVKTYCQQGLPKRAQRFYQALCEYYQTDTQLNINQFKLNEL